jgi:hypothetical protein
LRNKSEPQVKSDGGSFEVETGTQIGTQTEINPILFPPREVFEDNGLYIGTNDPHPEPMYCKCEEFEKSKWCIHCEGSRLPIAIGVEFPAEGGILLHYKGFRYPKKSWPFKPALNANDTVKRFIMVCVRFIGSFPKNLLYGRVIDSAIDGFTDFTDLIYRIHGVYWKPRFWCTMGREVWRIGTDMTSSERGIKFVKAICTLLEFDDAYRYYIQDGLGELNIDAFMKDPSRETKRILFIMALRKEGTREKFKSVAKVLPLLLYIPKVKKTMKEFFRKVDMEKMYLDEMDWYICMGWGGYEFAGHDDMQRARIRHGLDEDWKKKGSKHLDSEGNEIKTEYK